MSGAASRVRHFHYRGGEMFAENVPLRAIADAVGTPAYVYSRATLERHYRVFASGFADVPSLVAYSVKANSNLAVLRVLARLGAGADVVSGGELARALRAGIPAHKIVFSGVGKTDAEMARALEAGIKVFNVESVAELRALDRVARGMGRIAPVAFRVNPDVAAGGHAKISTGKAENKFGIPWATARDAYSEAARLGGIEVVGVDVHIGSQIADLVPFEAAIRRVGGLIAELRADGHAIRSFDLGGGLGIPYGDGSAPPPLPHDYAAMVKRLTAGMGVELIFEPGRMIAGNAGVLLARAVYVKAGGDIEEGGDGRERARTFLILDAAMNDLIRPALYGAFHEIEPVRETSERAVYDVVGPVCETGDTFARAREMARVEAGELVVFHTAGAYGAVQSGQYNTRPLAPEVLVDGERFHVIRRRPTVEEMLELESVPEWVE